MPLLEKNANVSERLTKAETEEKALKKNTRPSWNFFYDCHAKKIHDGRKTFFHDGRKKKFHDGRKKFMTAVIVFSMTVAK